MREERTIAPAAAIGLLVALAIPLFFVKLGAAALVDPDEPYYAVPALEMLKSGTWAVTVFHGQPWFDKPILFYWAVLAAFKTFGATEWAARVASALCGLGGAIAVATLAPRAWRARGAHVLAAVVLATSLEYAFLSRAAVTDMMLTFFLTIGFLATARWLESERIAWAVAAGAAFGLATLTKGPVGVLVPAIGLAGYGLAMRRRELLSPKPVMAAVAGFVVTAVPWYAYMLVAHRDLVLKVFLGEENLGRFVNPEHRQFPGFYLVVLALGLLPWSAALPAGLLRAWRAMRRREEGEGTSPGLVYAGFWFAAVLGLFSLSASKLLTYVLPAFPPAAFLIAAYWSEALAARPADTRLPGGARAAAWAGGAMAALAGVGLVVVARQPKFSDVGPAVYPIAAVIVVAAVLAAVAAWRGQLVRFAAAQAGVTVVIVLTFVTIAWPRLEEVESTKSLIARLRADGLADHVVAAYRVPDVSLDFYLGRTLPRETDEAKLAARVAESPGALWVLRAEEVDGLAARQGFQVERVDVRSRRWVVRLAPHDHGPVAEVLR
jgi:4-amino-4-deoxy-L-arabinose transferase-like glycosyltransferase